MSDLFYEEGLDRLCIELEEYDSKIPLLSVEPIKDLVELNISPTNGQLVSVEVNGLYKISEGIIPETNDFWYDENEDTLYAHFSEQDKDLPSISDLIWGDEDKITVLFNRNEVGNIIGIEICGVNAIIVSAYD